MSTAKCANIYNIKYTYSMETYFMRKLMKLIKLKEVQLRTKLELQIIWNGALQYDKWFFMPAPHVLLIMYNSICTS